MNSIVHQYKYNNLSFVTLISRDRIPVDPYVSAYICSSLPGYAFNTKVTYVNELKFVWDYFSAKNINLVERARSGHLLSRAEYNGFAASAKYLKGKSPHDKITRLTLLSEKSLSNAIHATAVSEFKVSAETTKRRITRFIHFLTCIFDVFHGGKVIKNNMKEKLAYIVCQGKRDCDRLKNYNSECNDPDESVIPSDTFFTLLEIIKPNSIQNPFKGSKLRNYLIISIFICSGIRRGALAKLKISDCHFYSDFNKVMITRNPDDKTDPRKFRPRQKTKAHAAAIHPTIMLKLKSYIDTVRSEFPNSNKHDFVFISEKDSRDTRGYPLALNSINAIFSKLSKTLNFKITPHKIRYKWNELFDDQASKMGYTSETIEDIRRYAMGWNEKSNMASIYNDFKLNLKNFEISMQRQNKLINMRGTK
ncbi:site-specific integrase [Aliikangiella sp. IMCC44359]|uniref:site-specific integrase n=1 Tax=Aliikangiella sp. IMCC44359 TaxID=3459125 RepID=UPI00403ABBE5